MGVLVLLMGLTLVLYLQQRRLVREVRGNPVEGSEGSGKSDKGSCFAAVAKVARVVAAAPQ